MFRINLIFLVCFFCLLTQSTSAQNTFQKHYGIGTEIGVKILETDGGFLVAGSHDIPMYSNFMITKTDAAGNVVWSKSYGGLYQDEAHGIDSTYDGGFIVAGYTSSYGGLTPNDYDNILLIKIDANGTVVWSRILEAGGIDIAYCVQETFDHGFILTGKTSVDMFLIKTDSTGIIEWTNIYGSATWGSDVGRAVIQKRDSSFAVLGMSTELVAPDTAAIVLIVNPTGTTLYSHYYQVMNSSIPDDVTYAYDLIQNQDGDLLIAGGSGGNYQGLTYVTYPYILKTDSLGNYLGGMIFAENSGASKALSVREVPGSGYIIGGTLGNYYPLMIRTDANLNTSWCYHYGNFSTPPNYNTGGGYNAITTADGGFALTGYRILTNPGIFMTIVKTDSTGQSGCNQGIPVFGGSASAITYTHFNGTVFSSGSGQDMAVTVTESNLILTDSTLCTSTGIEEYISNPISVHPNPANTFLHIELPTGKSSDYLVEIRDISGKVLWSDVMLPEESNIDVSSLKYGIYVLMVSDQNKIRWITKFVKI